VQNSILLPFLPKNSKTKYIIVVTKSPKNEKEIYIKEGIKIENSHEKNTPTTKEMFHLSERSKDNVIALKLDVKSFKNSREEVKKEDLEKMLKALVNVPPPKKWKENKGENLEN
jgi:tRNA splicing endonuclease